MSPESGAGKRLRYFDPETAQYLPEDQVIKTIGRSATDRNIALDGLKLNLHKFPDFHLVTVIRRGNIDNLSRGSRRHIICISLERKPNEQEVKRLPNSFLRVPIYYSIRERPELQYLGRS